MKRTRTLPVLAILLLVFAALLGSGFASGQGKRIEPKGLQPSELTVLAAADMQPVLEVLGPYFERRTGIKLKVSYGSSAALSEQVLNGAPADLFLSADYTFAERVVAAGKADTKDPVPYAKGILVLWKRNDLNVNPFTLDVLDRKDLKNVAVANEDHAPYGRAAMAALQKLKYLPNVKPHLVVAESVGQAAQFALSGNAQFALISQTIALSPQYKSVGTGILFPLEAYQDIRQCAVVMKDGKHRQEAHVLLNYLTSDEIQQHLPELGLQRIQ